MALFCLVLVMLTDGSSAVSIAEGAIVLLGGDLCAACIP